MIELTEQQIQALDAAGPPPRLVNPLTQETFVLVRLEDYNRLQNEDYDDSPWSREELEALIWERSERSDVEGLIEHHNPAEQS